MLKRIVKSKAFSILKKPFSTKTGKITTGIFTSYLFYTQYWDTEVETFYLKNSKNVEIFSKMPILEKKFRSTFYLPIRLIEMALAARIEKTPLKFNKYETVQLKDGDRLILGIFD